MASMERKIKQAFENAAPSVLDSVLAECETKVTDIVPMTVKKPRFVVLRYVATAAMLVLLVGIGAMAASIIALFGGLDVKPSDPQAGISQSSEYQQQIEKAWKKISDEPFGTWYSENNPNGGWRAYSGNILFYCGGDQANIFTTIQYCGSSFSHVTSFRLFYYDNQNHILVDVQNVNYSPIIIQQVAQEHEACQRAIYGDNWQDLYHHNFESKNLQEPTCTTQGWREDTCVDCGFRRTQETPATGHKWIVQKNGSRLCIVCNATEDSHIHNYQHASNAIGSADRPAISTYRCTKCSREQFTYTGTTGVYDLDTIMQQMQSHAEAFDFEFSSDDPSADSREYSYTELFRVLESNGGHAYLQAQALQLLDDAQQDFENLNDGAHKICIKITYLEDADHTIGAFQIQIFIQ